MNARLLAIRESPSILPAMRLAMSLAADATTTLASPAWVKALDAAIDDRADDLTAIAAVHALARLPDADAFDRLAERLHDGRPFIREHAVWALAASPVPAADERAVAGTLASVRLGGLAGMLGQLTVERLARRPPGPDRWQASIRHALVGATLPGERVRLIETLGLIRHPDVIRHLRRTATDPEELTSVRVAAIAALGDRSDSPSGTTLRSLARTEGPTGDAARLAMVDRLGTPAAPPARAASGEPLRIGQLYLHAALDPELTTVGMGETGGIATLLVRLGDALVARPSIGSVTTISGGSAERALASLHAPPGHAFAAVPIGETVPAGIGAAWPGLIDARRGIRRILRAHGPMDLLHLRMADVGSLAGAMAARTLGVDTVFSLAPDPHALIAAAERDGSLSRAGFGAADTRAHLWYRVALVQRLSEQARRIALFPRPDLRAQLRELVGIDIAAEPGRSVIVPEGIDTTAIAAASADPSPAWPDVDAILEQIPEDRRGRPLVVSVGRMHDVKGMARLVDAWAGCTELVTSTNLIVVGGDLRDPSPDEAAELQRIEAVRASSGDACTGLVLAGHQPSSTVARLLVTAHRGDGALAGSGGAYACGSRKEEFGLAIVEAMAAGLPVVVPASGGPASYIEEGWTGFARGHHRSAGRRRRPAGRAPRLGRRRPGAHRAAHGPGTVHDRDDGRRDGDALRRAGGAAGHRGRDRPLGGYPDGSGRVTILVISPDYASHLLPLATLASGLAADGRRVVIATGPAVAPLVAEFGHEHRTLVLARGSNPGVIRADDQPSGEDDRLRGFFAATHHGMIATLEYQAAARRDDLLWDPLGTARHVQGIVAAVQPTMVVVDHLAFSATLALRAADIDYVDVILGHPTALPVGDEVYGDAIAWPAALRPERAAAERLRRRCEDVRDGFTAAYNEALLTLDPAAAPVKDAFAAHGRLVLFNYPAALHDPARTAFLPAHAFLGSLVRPETVPADIAAWLAVEDPRPVVYVSFGSFLSARTDVLRTVIEGLRGAPVRVALASGSSDLSHGPAVPADWLVRPFLPQIALLDRAALAITHAGNNSVTEALTAGVPVLALPFSTDQFAGAEAIESAGLGLALDPNAVDARGIGDVVEAMLAGPFRERASSIGTRLRGEPGPMVARRAIEGLTSGPLSRGSAGGHDLVADRDPARDGDVGKDPEVGVLALAQPSVGDDPAQRVQVAHAGVRVLGRDGAAGVGLGHVEHGGPDGDSARRSRCPPRARRRPRAR